MNILEKFSKNMLKKNLGLAIQAPISNKFMLELIQNYSQTKRDYHKNLMTNMNAFIGGHIDLDSFISKQKDCIRDAFKSSYSIGKNFGLGRVSSLDDKEKRFIAYQIGKEMQFMKKFAVDIKNQTGKMKYARRMKMYSDSLDPMFSFGRLVYMPEEVQILWKLGRTDRHCLDCILFASQNPYTKKTLPGLPKSGSTRCLSNCRCRIEYVLPSKQNNSDYEEYILNHNHPKKDIPTEEDYLQIIQFKERYYHNRLKYEMEKDKRFMEIAKDELAGLRKFQKRNNFVVETSVPVLGVLTELRHMKKNKLFEYKKNHSDLVYGDFVGYFEMDEFKYGRVKSIFHDKVIVHDMTHSQNVLHVDRHIIFKEVAS